MHHSYSITKSTIPVSESGSAAHESRAAVHDCRMGPGLLSSMVTPIVRIAASLRVSSLCRARAQAQQRETFFRLLRRASFTRFGIDHGFSELLRLPYDAAYRRYRSDVPIRNYDDFWREYFEVHHRGGEGASGGSLVLRDVTWPGLVTRFCETSGTTAPSKFIPFTDEMFAANRRAALDLLSCYLQMTPGSSLLTGRFLYLSGSTNLSSRGEGIVSGDMSALTLRFAPWYLRPFLAHGDGIARLPWEEKVERLAHLLVKERNVTGISGVPPWILQLLRRCREIGGEPISLLLPRLELVIHGGTSMIPYRQEFETLFDGASPHFLEVLPASEGFMGFQYAGERWMRLTPWYGIFFEFLPVESLDGSGRPLPGAEAFPLAQVREGERYALVLSTCSGLWRYLIGDTVRIVSRDTLAFEFTGRDRCLDSFEEKVTQEEVERAVQRLSKEIGVEVQEFMVGSEIPSRRHLWVLEVRGQVGVSPHRVSEFLDRVLREGNADYDTFRRQGRIAPPLVRIVPDQLIYRWSREMRGRVGGQNKIPRLDPTSTGELISGLAGYGG